MGFPKKTLKSWKNADGSKIDVECNWYSMISQKDQNLGYAKKQMFFFWKRNLIFLKQAEDRKNDAEYKWNREISQNVRKLGSFQKRVVPKKVSVFQNSLMVASLL